MLDRLKSLPLTIILTILIWMYAESQFTTTRDGVAVPVRINPTAEFAVRAADPATGQWRERIVIQATIQGPQAQVDHVVAASRGRSESDRDFAALALEIPPDELHRGSDNSVDTVALLNHLPYFHNRGLTVTAALPPRLQLEAMPIAASYNVLLPAVPVTISGPPEVLRKYNVQINPSTVSLQLIGPKASLSLLDPAKPETLDKYVRATLDLDASDTPTDQPQHRGLRFALPEGVTIGVGPKDIEFRLTPRPQ